MMVEWLRWWRSSEGELAPARATAALGAEAAAVGGEEGSWGNANGERGAVRASAGADVVRSGLAWPRGTAHRRRAASSWLHAARELWQWSATEAVDSVRQSRDARPDNVLSWSLIF